MNQRLNQIFPALHYEIEKYGEGFFAAIYCRAQKEFIDQETHDYKNRDLIDLIKDMYIEIEGFLKGK